MESNIYYECEDGWLPLIKDALLIVDNWNLKHNPETLCEFIQIKEKWGKLCLYLNFYPDEIVDQIHQLENESLKICEYCGTDKNVSTTKIHGWYRTLCDECKLKVDKEYGKSFQ